MIACITSAVFDWRVSACNVIVYDAWLQVQHVVVSGAGQTGTMSELEQLRQEAEQLRNQIRVSVWTDMQQKEAFIWEDIHANYTLPVLFI